MKALKMIVWLCLFAHHLAAQTNIVAQQMEKAQKEIQSVLNVLDMAAEMSKLDDKGIVLQNTLTLYPNLKERVKTAKDLQAVQKEGGMREWIVETIAAPIFAYYKAEGAKLMLREFLMTF